MADWRGPVRRVAVAPDGEEVDYGQGAWPLRVCIGARMNGSWPLIVVGSFDRVLSIHNTGREYVIRARYA